MVRMNLLHKAVLASGWGKPSEALLVTAEEGEVINRSGCENDSATGEALIAEVPYIARFEFTGVRGDARDLLAVFVLWLAKHGKQPPETIEEEILRWSADAISSQQSNLVVEVRLVEKIIVRPAVNGAIKIGKEAWARVEECPASPEAKTLAVAEADA